MLLGSKGQGLGLELKHIEGDRVAELCILSSAPSSPFCYLIAWLSLTLCLLTYAAYRQNCKFCSVCRTVETSTLKTVDKRLFTVFRNLSKGRGRTVVTELTIGRTPSSSRTFYYSTTTRGPFQAGADSVTVNTPSPLTSRFRHRAVVSDRRCLHSLPTSCRDFTVQPSPRWIPLTSRRWQGQASRHRDAACYAIWLRCTF